MFAAWILITISALKRARVGLTRIAEDKYLRNMTKYEAAINELYRCKRHREMSLNYETLRRKSKSELLDILRNTHPDR